MIRFGDDRSKNVRPPHMKLIEPLNFLPPMNNTEPRESQCLASPYCLTHVSRVVHNVEI